MKNLSRRDWLKASGGALITALALPACSSRDEVEQGCSLGFGSYGLPGYSLEDSIRLISQIGYDAIEIVSIPGYHGDPELVSLETRKTVRQFLSNTGLKLGALMGLPTPSDEVKKQQSNLDWFKRLLQLAHDLKVDNLPLIQGVLGGGKWDQKKNLFRDQVGQWLELAAEAGITLSIKPHRGHAMSTPDDAVWIIHELGDHPKLRMVYDYSHYAFRDMPIETTVVTALPYTSYLVMKDAVQENGKVVFKLPGQAGTIDHARVLSLFYDGGYRGEVCPEVSSLVWRAEGYDPETTARTCYRNLSNIFSEAGVPRI